MSEEKALMEVEKKIKPAIVDEFSIDTVKIQVDKIQKLMKAVMKEGEHFGVIPGTSKPSLLKPGAEKLGFTFRLIPKFKITRYELSNNHREYEIQCILEHQQTGAFAGEGVGSCSTMESKYRYRIANRICPTCGNEAIIKGKEEYGGGWVCFKKKGGCGAKFVDTDKQITSQFVGQMENPDIADTYNTVLKMAKKRAHIDAMITACAASDIFTQDLEDIPAKDISTKKKEPIVEKKKNGWHLPKEWKSTVDEMAVELGSEHFEASDLQKAKEQIKKCKSLEDVHAVKMAWHIEFEKRVVAYEEMLEGAAKATDAEIEEAR